MTNPIKRLLPAKWRSDATTIPIVRLSGAIASGSSPLRPTLSLAVVASQLEKAFSFKKAPAVAVVINSPGGSPVQANLIHGRIRQLASEKNKKVHVFVEDVAASGGYMIACAGDDITCDPSSIVGSIGVVSSGFGFVEAIERLGISRRLYTAGENKALLDPFSPEREEDVARLKALQLEIHQIFIDLVKESRGSRLSDHRDLFTGLFWTARPAIELGLADAIGDMRSTLKQRYGEKTRLQLIEPRKGLFGRRGGFSIAEDAVERAVSGLGTSLLSAAEEKALWSRYGL